MVDQYKAFTDYDWDSNDRPELQIHPTPKGICATLEVGGNQVVEIKANSPADLKDQLDGYAEIFKAAADSL